MEILSKALDDSIGISGIKHRILSFLDEEFFELWCEYNCWDWISEEMFSVYA